MGGLGIEVSEPRFESVPIPTTISASVPNDAAIERLVTAVIVEQHDEWAVAERRYLSETSMARLRQNAPALPATSTKRKRLAS